MIVGRSYGRFIDNIGRVRSVRIGQSFVILSSVLALVACSKTYQTGTGMGEVEKSGFLGDYSISARVKRGKRRWFTESMRTITPSGGLTHRFSWSQCKFGRARTPN
jgi:hypothetical protein